MKFSVIVTAHNLEAYIGRAILSVLDQSFKNYELLVICDACTDSTVEIVEELGIKPIITDAKAPGLARNAGLDAAQGEYVLFLDGDDRFLHTEAFAMINGVLGGERFDIVNFGFIYGVNGYVAPHLADGSWWINVWCRAWRREFIGADRFGPLRRAEDAEFCGRMFKKKMRAAEWNTPFIYYTFPRAGSLSDKGVKPD